MKEQRFDALFITVFPSYPAVLGPLLRREFRVAFVLDLQDPIVGSWGQTVGPGKKGQPDFKSRVSRRVAIGIEHWAVSGADGITAVSDQTYADALARNPAAANISRLTLPIGAEEKDFGGTRPSAIADQVFARRTAGEVHICYVGTLLPLGVEILRAFFRAVGDLKRERAALYDRLRLTFIGTSNQTDPDAAPRVLPVARELGIEDRVSEISYRIDYLDAVAVQQRASALLLLGSTEPHYTASKLYPALLSRRPLLAVYHHASSVSQILRRFTSPPSVRLVEYSARQQESTLATHILPALEQLIAQPTYRRQDVNPECFREFSAETIAGKLAGLLDEVTASLEEGRSRGPTGAAFVYQGGRS
jgi:hypothetical protein